MILSLLYGLAVFLFVVLIVFIGNFKKVKTNSARTIVFLNEKLTNENLGEYVLIETFDNGYLFEGSFPDIIDNNLKNSDYQKAYNEYIQEKKRLILVSLIILISIAGILLFGAAFDSL